jgi:hypothetical protein
MDPTNRWSLIVSAKINSIFAISLLFGIIFEKVIEENA